MTKWPESHRGWPASDATVLVKSTTVSCSLHADSTTEAVTMAAAPVVDGNGHPLEDFATHYGRCPTCDRLYLRVDYDPSVYRPISTKITIADTYAIDQWTWIDGAAPSTPQFGSGNFVRGDGTGSGQHGLISIPPIDSWITSRSQIVKAVLNARCHSAVVGAAFTLHEIVQPAVLTESTWNEYRSGDSWASAGAADSVNDYDGSTAIASVILSASTDPTEMIVTEEWRSWVESHRATGGLLLLRAVPSTGAWEIQGSGVGLTLKRPSLSLWCQ